MPTTCTSLFNIQQGYPVKRKVIDTSGRVGSLYHLYTDEFIDRHSVSRCEGTRPKKPYISRVFVGDQSRELFDYLRNIGFDREMQQNLRRRTVRPSGIAQFIEYNQQVNSNTRFLYYCYRSRRDEIPVKARKTNRIVAPPPHSTEATHMITQILWGFEFLCVIQPPRNHSAEMIDRLLRRLSDELKRDRIPSGLTSDDTRLLNEWNDTAIYGSERCIDDPGTSLLAVLDQLQDWQRNRDFHQPVEYTMQPLRWLFGVPFQTPCYTQEDSSPHLRRIESVRQRLESQLKQVHDLLLQLPESFASATLTAQLRDMHQQYADLLDSQEHLEERLRKAIPAVCAHRSPPTVLNDIIADQRYLNLHKNEIDKILLGLERLSTKAALIDTLTADRIEYANAYDFRADRAVSPTNDQLDILLKRSYSSEGWAVILWYSTDRLKREQAVRWTQTYQQILSRRRQVAQAAKLVYADFTNCQERLEDFVVIELPPARGSNIRRDPIIEITPRPSRTTSNPSLSKTRHPLVLPPPEQEVPQRRSITPPPISSTAPTIAHPTRPPNPTTSAKTDINVLLLGETGVGKSTFINAFVNYLKFDTLQQAEQGKPVVLIPVSFFLTVGDQFDEVVVKFGDADPNEDHEHEGQSVTQQCKSYIFDLNDRFRLRLIDSPGIGDTRGIEQDVKNIDHVLTYINNLPHINAICLLLKPNASRLNVFLRSCIRQLLTYVTPIGYSNIIFCFTNARATFYAPGDTGPLLRKMLTDEKLNIPFQRDNTFCFDSESFRYLAAKRCRVDFDDYQAKECSDSWNTSVTESLRLLNFIQTRKPYNLNTWQSLRKAALDIAMLARPLMETLRLIIYNWQLSEAKLIANQIVLNPNQIDVELCTNCAQINMVEVGPLWIVQYQQPLLRTSANQHRLCPTTNKHVLIESIVQHQFVTEPAGLKNERWQSSFHNFLLKCDTLLHFLRQQARSTPEDPFQPILDRFLEEEQQISQHRNINSSMNRKVRDILLSIRNKRQLNQQQISEAKERLPLKQVYQIINELMAIPTVHRQIDSIRRSRQLKMRAHEIQVATDAIQNRAFARLSSGSP